METIARDILPLATKYNDLFKIASILLAGKLILYTLTAIALIAIILYIISQLNKKP